VHVLITGINGQDGSYLAEQLLAAGHQPTGLIPPHEPVQPYLLDAVGKPLYRLEHCDLAEPAQLRHLLRALKPDRVFHLAAISFPPHCEQNPELSRKVNVTSVEVLLEWLHRDSPASRALVCSSSAVFGSSSAPLQESSPVQPGSEYGRQKQQVRELAAQARREGLFAACAIPFNHESERRPERFAFAKICVGAARIALGQQQYIELGNLDPVRDWGYAPEYVTAYTWMLDVTQPAELVIATGEGHTVSALVDAAFAEAGLAPEAYIRRDATLLRNHDPSVSVGNPARALEELNWEAGTKFHALVRRLVRAAVAHYI
jgi:GDPmannose 4,6-dehydratase